MNSLIFKTTFSLVSVLIAMTILIVTYVTKEQSTLIETMNENKRNYIISTLENTEEKSIEREIENLKNFSISQLGSIASSVYNVRYNTIELTLKDFLKNKNIKAVTVFDTASNEVFKTAQKLKDGTLFYSVKKEIKSLQHLRKLKFELIMESEKIGYIDVYYDTKYIQDAIALQKSKDLEKLNLENQKTKKHIDSLLTNQMIAFFAMVVILSLLTFVLLDKFVNAPLKKMKIGLDSFFLFLQNKTDTTSKIDIESNDEFGYMAKTLNENIEVSAKLHEEINELNSNLEKKVEERTTQLREVNNQLTSSIEYASLIQSSLIPAKDKFNSF